MANEQVKTQEAQDSVDNAELTDEQLEVIAGGTGRTDTNGGGCTTVYEPPFKSPIYTTVKKQ